MGRKESNQTKHVLEKYLNIEGFLDIEVLENEHCFEKYWKNHSKVFKKSFTFRVAVGRFVQFCKISNYNFLHLS